MERVVTDAKQKTILVTGSTDGIGLETAKMLVAAEESLSMLPGSVRAERPRLFLNPAA